MKQHLRNRSVNKMNQSIDQRIKTRLHSAVCRERIRGANE